MHTSISNDPEDMDLDVIHGFLTTSYWSPGISKERVENAMRNSLPFGVFLKGEQVAYARVVSDYTTFAYLGDVFVVPEHRGKGFSRQLLTAIHDHPGLQGLRSWYLRTEDAQGLYRRFGWISEPTPENIMIYRPSSSTTNQSAHELR